MSLLRLPAPNWPNSHRPSPVSEEEIRQFLKQVIRVATEVDRRQVEENKKKAEGPSTSLSTRLANGLPMKLVDVEHIR